MLRKVDLWTQTNVERPKQFLERNAVFKLIEDTLNLIIDEVNKQEDEIMRMKTQ